MGFVGLFFAGLAALLHIYIWVMESLTWTSARTRATFGLTEEEALATKELAFNQGFYNLFLALGVLLGLGLVALGGNQTIGTTLILFNCACMLGAAVVLRFSGGRQMLRASVMQGIFPLLAWGFWLGLAL